MGTQNLNPIDELKTLDEQVERINDLPGLKPIFFRLEEIAKQHPNDFQVQLNVGDIKQHLVNRGTKLKQQPAAPPAMPPPAMPPPMPPRPSAGLPPPMPLSQAAAEPPPRPAPPTLDSPIAPPPAVASAPPPMPPPLWEQAPEPVAAAPTPPPMPPPMAPAAGPPPFQTTDPTPDVAPSPFASSVLPVASEAFAAPPPEPPAQTAPQVVPTAPAPMKAAPPPRPPKPPVNWKRALWMGGVAGALIALAIIGTLMTRKRRQQDIASAGLQVEIATTPPGASVRINGDTNCTSDCKLSLPPGNYQVTAFLDGYEPAASGITVAAGAPASFSLALEPQAQSLRILTDLPQGKIVVDDQPPADLLEGQFIVDKIAPGPHTVKLTGKSGEATFSFEIALAKIPSITGPVVAKNLSAVMVTSLGNQARVVTNAGPLKLLVNGQPEADTGPAGTDLKTFQTGVDELIVGEGKDQRTLKESFGPAPMLTAFLRSDLNIGTLIVSTGKEDGVRVFVNNREQPQKTQRGLVRVQTIGAVSVRVMKEGFEQPAVQTSEVKKGTDTRLDFTLKALPQLSTLQITGGTPGAEVLIDQRNVGTIGPDGGFVSSGLTPGDHVVGIRRDQFSPRQLPRTFRAGQTVVISGADAVLTAERPQPAPAPANKQPVPPPAPKEVASAKPPPPAAGTMSDWEDNSMWKEDGGVWMHQGAAFIPYKMTPQGVFTFTVQLLKGGNLFRGGKIRWAVNRTDDKNYALYEMDSKNFWAKVVAKGKTLERTHIQLKDLEKQKSFTVQIDVVPEHIVHKMFTGGEWITLDSWAETGRNFSQGKFGFLVQGNDQIGISEFKFLPK